MSTCEMSVFPFLNLQINVNKITLSRQMSFRTYIAATKTNISAENLHQHKNIRLMELYDLTCFEVVNSINLTFIIIRANLTKFTITLIWIPNVSHFSIEKSQSTSTFDKLPIHEIK